MTDNLADNLFQAQVRELGWGVIYGRPGLEPGHILLADLCADKIPYSVVVLGPASTEDVEKARPIFHRIAGMDPTDEPNLTLYRAMVD
jgi:hypothetical protein